MHGSNMHHILSTCSFSSFAFRSGIFNPTIVYDHLGEIYSTLIFGSFIFCILLYIKGHVAPSSSDSGSCGNFIIDFYWITLYLTNGESDLFGDAQDVIDLYYISCFFVAL
ncbi:7-dehydrocholesterol reductase-like [Spinacia oleracea]|uniref:7-dehydrocholesterol reductase-like n=1 Tax=Spinacia oleracea TaxID=3562 RepID=A0ABM3RWC1_SPIOL|nr:7-dehydrocholesterol reductase-like [Spinacia oleracea]